MPGLDPFFHRVPLFPSEHCLFTHSFHKVKRRTKDGKRNSIIYYGGGGKKQGVRERAGWDLQLIRNWIFRRWHQLRCCGYLLLPPGVAKLFLYATPTVSLVLIAFHVCVLLVTGSALYHFHFWFNACVLKLLPCLLLSALTLCLIRALLKAHQHSQKLLSTPSENFPMVITLFFTVAFSDDEEFLS